MRKLIRKALGKREGLNKKWWHRLIKVAFFFSLIIVFLFSLAISLSSTTTNTRNSTIISNLRDFTASSDFSTVNTIPSFLEINGELGCYNPEKSEIDYVSEYLLEGSFCSYDIVYRVDDAVSFFNRNNPGANYTRDGLSKILNKDTNKRYCLIKRGIDCQSRNIVKYNKASLFYIEAIFYSLIPVLIWGALGIVFYYRLFLYIIFGNKEKLS